MKIVITTDVFYPMINGVATFSRNLAAGLKKRGHNVLVLAPSITGKPSMETDEEYGFKVARISSSVMHLYPDQINKVPESPKLLGMKMPKMLYKNGLHVSFNAYSEVKKILDEFEPDIIHNQTPGPLALSIMRYARRRKVPLVSTDHCYPENLTQQVRIPSLAKKPINAAMNAYFVSFLRHSEYATMPTEQAIADCIPKNRKHFKVPVEAISNGIDLSRFAPGRANKEIYEKYHIPKDRKIVLYCGRVDPEKSLDVLMEAFIQAQPKLPDVHLVIIGDGRMRSILEKMAEKAGISDKVTFTGRVVGDDLPQLYRTGDMFAITSTTETQSIVLMEAMASGLPAIAVKAGAVPELVRDGKTGYLCEAGDVDAIAKDIQKIISNDEKRKKMSDETLKFIRKHDISYTLTRMEEIYCKVLDARKAKED